MLVCPCPSPFESRQILLKDRRSKSYSNTMRFVASDHITRDTIDRYLTVVFVLHSPCGRLVVPDIDARALDKDVEIFAAHIAEFESTLAGQQTKSRSYPYCFSGAGRESQQFRVVQDGHSKRWPGRCPHQLCSVSQASTDEVAC